MTREWILRNRLEMASHNLMCYSKNYLMDTPKDGCEVQHKEAAAEVELLTAWLKEFPSTRIDSTVEFVGHITGWSWDRSYDGRRHAMNLNFEVDTGASYFYGDRRIFGIGPEVQAWFVTENGGCGSYDIEKERRESWLVRITVDLIQCVRKIEWAVEE